MDAVIGAAADAELREVVIGMPHRGRLNVLVNVVGKAVSQVFQEFEGNIDPKTAHGSGDVKYHLGADGTAVSRAGNEITVSLTSNPSHLEAVDPVLEGSSAPSRTSWTRRARSPASWRCCCTATPPSPGRASSRRR